MFRKLYFVKKDPRDANRLVVNPARIAQEGSRISGELDFIDLDDDKFVKPLGKARFDLFVQIVAGEMLVKGRLEHDFRVVCSRCGEDFDMCAQVDDFVQSYEISEKTQEVDLTSDARDSIILNLPTYPVCRETCPGVAESAMRFSDDRWNVLDDLMKEEGDKKNGKS